jgi:two-component system NarL family sensor kinase
LPDLPAGVEVAAYRIVLEAVHNVALHAEATSCRIALRMEHQPGGSALRVEVADTGIGIQADRVPGVGLASMAERAAELGGTFDIGPGSSGGTSVRVLLPMPGAGLRDDGKG